MGNGTSDGVQTPKQPGVIVREGENFPIIPQHLLTLTQDQLQAGINRLVHASEMEASSLLPDFNQQEKIETTRVIYEFAKVAVERNLQIPS